MSFKKAILEFYQDDGTAIVEITESQNLLQLIIEHINRTFKNTTQIFEENIYIFCRYPLINYIESLEKVTGIDNSYLYNFLENIDSGEVDSAPPYCYAAHDRKNNGLKIGTDFLGYGKVYQAAQGKVKFFLSHQAVLSFALDDFSVNLEYWHQCLTWGVTVDGSASFQSLKLLEPETKLQFEGITERVNLDNIRYSVLKKQRRLNETPKTLLTKAVAACRKQLRNGTLLSSTIGSVGLVGDRDSRLILSLAMAEKFPIKCHTGYPPNAEVDVGKKLIDASEQKLDWKAEESKEFSPPEGDLLEQARSAYFKYESDSWPSPVRKSISALDSNRIANAVFISGGAEEIARSHFYTEKDIHNPQMRLNNYLKFVNNANVLIPKHFRNTTSIQLRKIMNEDAAAGLKEFDLLGYFFIRSRIRRAYPKNTNQITSIFTIEILLHAFSISLKDKVRGATVTELTNSLKPEWSGIPYLSDVQHKYKFEDINKTSVLPYHWEPHSSDWPSIVRELSNLNLLSSHGKARLAKVRRGDKDAVLVSGTVDRMLWYYGFLGYHNRIFKGRTKFTLKHE